MISGGGRLEVRCVGAVVYVCPVSSGLARFDGTRFGTGASTPSIFCGGTLAGSDFFLESLECCFGFSGGIRVDVALLTGEEFFLGEGGER